LTTTGEIPSARYGHTSVIFGDSMFVFGGYDVDSSSCNDLCELDLSNKTKTFNKKETLNWKTLGVKEKPPLRYHHKSLMVDDKMLVNSKFY
jgi:hypothetical protein